MGSHFTIKFFYSSIETHGDGCPYQGDYSFDDHRSVKNWFTLSFRGHTSRHQGRLCGMKTGNRATGNRNKDHRKHRETCRVDMLIKKK